MDIRQTPKKEVTSKVVQDGGGIPRSGSEIEKNRIDAVFLKVYDLRMFLGNPLMKFCVLFCIAPIAFIFFCVQF